MRKLLTSPWTLLAVIALLRLPGFAFGVLNIDESDYLVYGAGILKGLLPYRDLVEIKPPLGYFTYALAGGLSIWPIRVLGGLWVLGTALLLRAAARRWTGREGAGGGVENLAHPRARGPRGPGRRAASARCSRPLDRQRGSGVGGGVDVDPRRVRGSAGLRR